MPEISARFKDLYITDLQKRKTANVSSVIGTWNVSACLTYSRCRLFPLDIITLFGSLLMQDVFFK